MLYRNLAFTYFDSCAQRTLLQEMLDQLRPGGVLVIGRRETLPADVTGIELYRRDLGICRTLSVGTGGNAPA